MLEKTDEQADAILEAIRNVTPEVAEQAVAYYRAVEIGWLGIIGSVMLAALIICFKHWLVARREGWDDCGTITGHGIIVIISGIVAGIALLICACIAGDLACIFYAPDYYAAECLIELGKSALSK